MTVKRAIVLGSRGSKLALAQVEIVREVLAASCPDLLVKVATYTTKGDSVTDVPLSQVGGTGIFTSELESALQSGEIDIAVHSLKDVPSEIDEGLAIAGVLERADPRDAFLSEDGRLLEELEKGDTVGTSSLRRKAQLCRINPGAVAVDIRGNIDTRIRKLFQGHCDGIILAAAGLHRAGFESSITEYLRLDTMLPAPTQGIIGLEVRGDDKTTIDIVAYLNHKATWLAAAGERSFLREVEGGCRIPVGCHAALDKATMEITGLVADVDGTRLVRRFLRGPADQAADLGKKLAGEILASGGREILEIVRTGNI
ncbi:MAG: hydroxymethylbilane synthase [Spirochaetales bacterium]|nr:hydroxymethylbilane synthase [Spirochaetales bacterium]